MRPMTRLMTFFDNCFFWRLWHSHTKKKRTNWSWRRRDDWRNYFLLSWSSFNIGWVDKFITNGRKMSWLNQLKIKIQKFMNHFDLDFRSFDKQDWLWKYVLAPNDGHIKKDWFCCCCLMTSNYNLSKRETSSPKMGLLHTWWHNLGIGFSIEQKIETCT